MKSFRLASAAIIAFTGYSGFLGVYAIIIRAPFYYILPLLVLSGLLAFSLKLNAAHRANLTLVIISTWISLLAADAVLSSLPNEGSPVRLSFLAAGQRANVPFDTRTKLQVIDDLRNAGGDAYPLVVPKMFLNGGLVISGEETFPLGGISNRTIVACNETGEYLIFESDEHGFHNPKGIWVRDAIDMVSVGDSMTYGACVKSDENATALIRNVYPNTLNLGSGGSGPLLELAVLKEYVGDLKPKAVLWFYYEGNDLGNLALEIRAHPIFMKYLDSRFRQSLSNKQMEIDHSLVEFVNQEEEKLRTGLAPEASDDVAAEVTSAESPSFFVRLWSTITLKTLRQRVIAPLTAGQMCSDDSYNAHDWASELKAMGRILSDANKYVNSWNGEMYFVYLPAWTRYAPSSSPCLTKEIDMISQHDRIVEIAQDAGLPVLDMTRPFSSQSDPLSLWPFGNKGHYNKSGYKLVADTILGSIETNLESPASGKNAGYLTAILTPVSLPTIKPAVVEPQGSVLISWQVKNDGDVPGQTNLVLGNPLDNSGPAYTIPPGETVEVKIWILVDLVEGQYQVPISVAHTYFSETLVLSVETSTDGAPVR